jgi:hypothetical protein
MSTAGHTTSGLFTTGEDLLLCNSAEYATAALLDLKPNESPTTPESVFLP